MVRAVSKVREAPKTKEDCQADPEEWPLHKVQASSR